MQGGANLLARFETGELVFVADRKFHGHGLHPGFAAGSLDGAMLDGGDVAALIEADDAAAERVLLHCAGGLRWRGAGADYEDTAKQAEIGNYTAKRINVIATVSFRCCTLLCKHRRMA